MLHKIKKDVDLIQYPCLRCGYDGDLGFYHDKHYDQATYTCNNCQHKVRGNLSWVSGTYEQGIEKIWNPDNDPRKELANQEEFLQSLPELKQKALDRINYLKSLLKKIGL